MTRVSVLGMTVKVFLLMFNTKNSSFVSGNLL